MADWCRWRDGAKNLIGRVNVCARMYIYTNRSGYAHRAHMALSSTAKSSLNLNKTLSSISIMGQLWCPVWCILGPKSAPVKPRSPHITQAAVYCCRDAQKLPCFTALWGPVGLCNGGQRKTLFVRTNGGPRKYSVAVDPHYRSVCSLTFQKGAWRLRVRKGGGGDAGWEVGEMLVERGGQQR